MLGAGRSQRVSERGYLRLIKLFMRRLRAATSRPILPANPAAGATFSGQDVPLRGLGGTPTWTATVAPSCLALLQDFWLTLGGRDCSPLQIRIQRAPDRLSGRARPL